MHMLTVRFKTESINPMALKKMHAPGEPLSLVLFFDMMGVYLKRAPVSRDFQKAEITFGFDDDISFALACKTVRRMERNLGNLMEHSVSRDYE